MNNLNINIRLKEKPLLIIMFFKLFNSNNNSNTNSNSNKFNTVFTCNYFCCENCENTFYFRLFTITANNTRFAKIINPFIFYKNKFKYTIFFEI